jgi:hypothetical protein
MVRGMAEFFRAAGVRVTVEGTERVHVAVTADSGDDARSRFFRALQSTHGTQFGLNWRDASVLREERPAAARMRNDCDCGDYCAYCHPEMCL